MPPEKIISKTNWNLTTNSLSYQQNGETSLTKLNWKEALKIYKCKRFIYSAKEKKEIWSNPVSSYNLIFCKKSKKSHMVALNLFPLW